MPSPAADRPNPRMMVLKFLERGRRLSVQAFIPLGEQRTWTEETADSLAREVGQDASERFMEMGSWARVGAT